MANLRPAPVVPRGGGANAPPTAGGRRGRGDERCAARSPSITMRDSRRARGAPMQKWRPRPNAEWAPVPTSPSSCDLRARRRGTIGGRPQQEHAAVGGDPHVSEGGIRRGPAVVELEGAVVPQDVIERLGNALGLASQPFLQIRLRARVDRVGDQAAGGLGAGAEELDEDVPGLAEVSPPVSIASSTREQSRALGRGPREPRRAGLDESWSAMAASPRGAMPSTSVTPSSSGPTPATTGTGAARRRREAGEVADRERGHGVAEVRDDVAPPGVQHRGDLPIDEVTQRRFQPCHGGRAEVRLEELAVARVDGRIRRGQHVVRIAEGHQGKRHRRRRRARWMLTRLEENSLGRPTASRISSGSATRYVSCRRAARREPAGAGCRTAVAGPRGRRRGTTGRVVEVERQGLGHVVSRGRCRARRRGW